MPSLALLVVAVLSQAPLPDFTGEWKMVADAAASPLQTPPVTEGLRHRAEARSDRH
jgi:hypothetical protein